MTYDNTPIARARRFLEHPEWTLNPKAKPLDTSKMTETEIIITAKRRGWCEQ